MQWETHLLPSWDKKFIQRKAYFSICQGRNPETPLQPNRHRSWNKKHSWSSQLVILEWDWRRGMITLRWVIMKPPNTNCKNTAKLPAVMAEVWVWKTAATKRNIDNEDKCTAKRRMNWWKNLKTHKIIRVITKRNWDCFCTYIPIFWQLYKFMANFIYFY